MTVSWLGQPASLAAYGLLAGLVFAESGILLGFFLPGDTVLVAAGALSGGAHPRLSLPVLLVVVVAAAVGGDTVGYWFGRTTRRGLRTDGRRARQLAQARRLGDRYGVLAVVVARWIPWVRVFTPVLAGAARMPQRRFVPANVTGALAWAAVLLGAGHLGAQLG